MLTVQQITDKQFAPAGRGVYNSQEVDGFLREIAASYDEMSRENADLMKKLGILADKVEAYRKDEDAIKESLLSAHRVADQVRREANESAENQLTMAKTQSQSIIDNANAQADAEINDAKNTAKDIVANAREAVSVLQEKAKTESESAIAGAEAKAAEIISDAKVKGEAIVGDCEKKYNFYFGELEKLNALIAQRKELVSGILRGELDAMDGIPAEFEDIRAVYESDISVDDIQPMSVQPVSEPEAEPAQEYTPEYAPVQDYAPAQEYAPVQNYAPATEEISSQPDFLNVEIPTFDDEPEITFEQPTFDTPAEPVETDFFAQPAEEAAPVEEPAPVSDDELFESLFENEPEASADEDVKPEDVFDFDDDESFDDFKANISSADEGDEDIDSLFNNF